MLQKSFFLLSAYLVLSMVLWTNAYFRTVESLMLEKILKVIKSDYQTYKVPSLSHAS